MPGSSYEKLINVVNSNPHPSVKIYVSIQLFEPYNQLFYLARRLKQLKIISNYRLDENGVTHISLSEATKSFRFEGLEQLQQLQVQIQPELMMEIQRRRETEEAWEEARAARNLKAAHEGRFEEGRENTGNGRKRNVSSNISPPNMRKAPRMKGSPPSSSIQSTSSNQNTQRRPPIQSSGAPLPRGDAHPVQPYISAPQHHPPQGAAGGQLYSGAASGQQGAGYYHAHYYNGVPVNAGQGTQDNHQGLQTGGQW